MVPMCLQAAAAEHQPLAAHLVVARRSRLAGVPTARSGNAAEACATGVAGLGAAGVVDLRAAGVGGRELSDRRPGIGTGTELGVPSAPCSAGTRFCMITWCALGCAPRHALTSNIRALGIRHCSIDAMFSAAAE
jgi:hypothetical protein